MVCARQGILRHTAKRLLANVSAAAYQPEGEKPLGQVQTSDAGRYEIIYEWDWQMSPGPSG